MRRGTLRRAGAGALTTLALSACAAKDDSQATVTTLGAGEAAKIGAETVTVEEVRVVAATQGVSATEARNRLIHDALWAAATQTEPRLAPVRAMAARAALARAVIDDMDQRARAKGPPTNAEVAELTAERWAILDRPATVRVTHAVVQVKEGVDPVLAKKVAERLAEAVRGVTDPKEFIKRAQAVPASGLEIRAEGLPGMASDGRAPPPKSNPTGPTRHFDAQFAQAAHQIAAPGEQSGIIKSPFGYHVILLEKRAAEIRPSLEERRRMLKDDILIRRGRAELDQLLQQLRGQHPIEFDRAHDSLTARATAE